MVRMKMEKRVCISCSGLLPKLMRPCAETCPVVMLGAVGFAC